MIRMVAGVYGLIIKRDDGSTYTQGMGPESGPFSLTNAEEERLVSMKVAVYVDGEPAPVPAETPELPDGVVGIPEYSVDSSISDLRAVGKMCGLTFKVGMSKADMVAALDEHIAEHTVDDVDPDADEAEDIVEDSEPAPVFDAAEAVQ